MASEKKRLDQIIVDLGWVDSRSKAQAVILSGIVLVDDEPATKPGTQYIPSEVTVRLKTPIDPYVSRGAKKLLRAFESFGVSCRGSLCIDVGASTGGFTQVMLEKGATKVIAVDVGHNQLDWKIRSDPRVQVIEGLNARSLDPSLLEGQRPVFGAMDVSFISVTKIFKALSCTLSPGATFVSLVKPQFEVGKENIGKKGVVKSEEARRSAVLAASDAAKESGFSVLGLDVSPILGAEGNTEYLLHLNLGQGQSIDVMDAFTLLHKRDLI